MTDKLCSINWDYLPIKAHYFFFFGGMGGTVPYMQVLGKDLGISATAVGLVYTVVPFCIFLSKPIFGFITDFFRNIRLVLIVLVFVTSLAFLAVLLVPPLHEVTEGHVEVDVECAEHSNQVSIYPQLYNFTCLKSQLVKSEAEECELKSICLDERNAFGSLNISNDLMNDNASLLLTLTSQVTQNCSCFQKEQSFISCESNTFHCSKSETNDSTFVYRTYNFWLFALFSVISGSGAATTFCLSDAACYEVLGENPKLYGRQRLWATISWGTASFASGYLNDIVTGDSKQTDYSPGFYLMLALVIIDIIILSRMTLVKTNISTNICKDIGKIYTSWQTIIFSFAVYICGALTGLLWNYQLWYLTDLGASQTLLGLVIAVQCLVAEVPMFFFSEWFIITFGHFSCLVISFAAFALRIGLYVLLNDPWMTLPIELLHGLTFAVFYTAMTLYAADYAPTGTEATMLGVLGGLFEGLGVATGSLLGGVGFDKIGGRQTFFVASMLSLTCVLFFAISFHVTKKSSKKFEISRTATTTCAMYGSDSLK